MQNYIDELEDKKSKAKFNELKDALKDKRATIRSPKNTTVSKRYMPEK